MSSKGRIILISEREGDIEFFREASSRAEASAFIPVSTSSELAVNLSSTDPQLIIWDADHPEVEDVSHPASLLEIRAKLSNRCKPAQVALLLDQPVGRYSYLFESGGLPKSYFNHMFLRRYDERATRIYPRAMKAVLKGAPYDFKSFFSEIAKIQEIVIKKAEHRKAAVEAVNHFFEKRGLEPRLASRAALAVDEFLMNAIFDAARNAEGQPTRNFLDRQARFDLGPEEHVLVRAAYNEDYVGICVTDKYGSLNLEAAFRHIHQNFRDEEYRVKNLGPSAGLGLYAIVQNGLSLVFSCVRDERTDAMVFFPRTDSFREFRSSFQFLACDLVRGTLKRRGSS